MNTMFNIDLQDRETFGSDGSTETPAAREKLQENPARTQRATAYMRPPHFLKCFSRCKAAT